MKFGPYIFAALLACGAPALCSAQSADAATYGMSEVDVPPKPVSMSQPERNSDIAGEIGTVKLRLLIAPDGSVCDCTVEDSSNPKLNDTAVNTAKKWTFKPAMKGGQAVQVAATLPMRFK